MLQRALLQLGVLTRGAISSGKLYHSGALVVGEGLVSAYELESQVAIYPRVIIDDVIIKTLLNDRLPDIHFIESRIGHLIKKDRDGLYFIDYLGFSSMGTEMDWEERWIEIQKFVEAETLKQVIPRVRQKWLWLQEYVRQTMLCWNDPNVETRPHDTEGSLESRYPRDYRKTKTYQKISANLAKSVTVE